MLKLSLQCLIRKTSHLKKKKSDGDVGDVGETTVYHNIVKFQAAHEKHLISTESKNQRFPHIHTYITLYHLGIMKRMSLQSGAASNT